MRQEQRLVQEQSDIDWSMSFIFVRIGQLENPWSMTSREDGGQHFVRGIFTRQKTSGRRFCSPMNLHSANLVHSPILFDGHRKKRFNRRYTVATVKHPPKVMVWGSFSARGRDTLFFVPRGTTGNREAYLNILKQKSRIDMQMHHSSIFQHDSAPAHTSRAVQKWLAAMGLRFWSGQGTLQTSIPLRTFGQQLREKYATTGQRTWMNSYTLLSVHGAWIILLSFAIGLSHPCPDVYSL